MARQERFRSASARPRRAPEQAPPSIPCPRELRQCAPPCGGVRGGTSTPMQCFHVHSRCRKNSWQLLCAPSHAGCARAHFGCAGIRLLVHLWTSARERVRRLPNGRAGVDHTSQSCTTSCRTVLRRRDAESARLAVRPAGVRRTMRARCVLAQTDAYQESSSAARNSGTMGVDNVDHQSNLHILATSYIPSIVVDIPLRTPPHSGAHGGTGGSPSDRRERWARAPVICPGQDEAECAGARSVSPSGTCASFAAAPAPAPCSITPFRKKKVRGF